MRRSDAGSSAGSAAWCSSRPHTRDWLSQSLVVSPKGSAPLVTDPPPTAKPKPQSRSGHRLVDGPLLRELHALGYGGRLRQRQELLRSRKPPRKDDLQASLTSQTKKHGHQRLERSLMADHSTECPPIAQRSSDHDLLLAKKT
jgi:hypothetical protein